ncbi:Pectinesterase inhibitor domain [Dillenia turbinata]|uniref:Pectinesterase inhibitor domain n=1 Tax=Dillenia turbinata TaxID=194707 RepID=A0AAN8W5W7_9MAGN
MINPSNIWKALRLLGIWQAGNRIAVIIASNCYVDGDPRIANLKGFVTQGGDPVADMCSKTPYPDLCTSIGKAAGIKEADAREIGLAVHGKANPMAVETSNFIKQLLKQKQDPPVLNSLKYCNDLYDTMVILMGSIRAGLSGNPKFAEQYANSCATEGDSCEGDFPPSKSPLTDKNKAIHDHCAVMAALARMLEANAAGNRIAVIIASNCYVDGDPRIANLKGCRTTGLWAPPSPFWSAQKQRAHVQHFLCLRESSSVVTQGGDPVADMCSKTPYPDLCTSIGKAAGIKEADAREIGLAVHGKANPMAVETSNFIKQLLKQKQDPPVLNSLKYCNDLYDTMVIRWVLSGPDCREILNLLNNMQIVVPPKQTTVKAGNRIAVIIASNCYVDGDPRIANLKGCRTTGLWAPPSPFWSAQKQRAHVQHFLCLRESSSVVTQGGDPVADMCSKTPYPDLCTSIGKAAGIKEADAREIGLAVHGKANPMAVETSNFIKQLLKQKQDPPVLNSLKYCNDLYDTMVILMGSIRAGLSGNPKFAEQYANSCATEADYCEGDFPPSKSPLTDKNKAIHDHCAVMAALARMLL